MPAGFARDIIPPMPPPSRYHIFFAEAAMSAVPLILKAAVDGNFATYQKYFGLFSFSRKSVEEEDTALMQLY